MKDLLETIVEQNERILDVLEQISEKLTALNSIDYTLGSIAHELEWHTDLTTASQIVKAIDQVTAAVESQ